jgi:hypothetical protein
MKNKSTKFKKRATRKTVKSAIPMRPEPRATHKEKPHEEIRDYRKTYGSYGAYWDMISRDADASSEKQICYKSLSLKQKSA